VVFLLFFQVSRQGYSITPRHFSQSSWQTYAAILVGLSDDVGNIVTNVKNVLAILLKVAVFIVAGLVRAVRGFWQLYTTDVARNMKYLS
jgi:hypothetical protein